jgi:hypothetical protein
MKRIFLLGLLGVLSIGCSEDLTISNDVPGTWARVWDKNGNVVFERIDFGDPKSLSIEAIWIDENTQQVFLTAQGYRQKDDCPLGSATYDRRISSRSVTAPADHWQISHFHSSGWNDPEKECKEKKP